MNLRISGVVLLLPLLVACGGGKLTDAQKTALKETTTAASRTTNSARDAKGNRTAVTSDSRATFYSLITGTAPKPSKPSKPASDDAQTKMAQRLAEDCKLDLEEPTSTSSFFQPQMSYQNDSMNSYGSESGDFNKSSMNSSGPLKFSLKVTGEKCPVELDASQSQNFKMGQTSMEMANDFSFKYRVKEKAFEKLNDVTFAEMAGSMKAEGNQDGGKFNLEMNGAIASQKHGDVKIEVEGKGEGKGENQGEGEITAKYEFPDFTAELKMEVDGKNKKYSLNGEEISEEEFYGYLKNTIGQN